MDINHIFYKNCLIAKIENMVSEQRKKILDDLIASGSDTVAYRKNFQRLYHLTTLHAQLINKVYNFNTDNPEDYIHLVSMSMDLQLTTSVNA
jgi:hypothetical protein